MDKKKDTPAEVETVTVTMSRPVAEAVQAACEMYLRLHMGQFNDLAEDLCMAKHYADMDAKRFKNAEDEKEDFYRALENRNMMQDDMDRAYEIHDGTGQWFVEGQDDRFDEHGNVTHWMYYPAAPKD